MLSDAQCFAEIVLTIQNLGAWLVGPMRFLSILGNGALYAAIACAVYWNVDTRMGLRLGSLFLLSVALNSLAKLAFHTPRPYWCDPRVAALAAEASFGFPSGHAQNAATMWLALALIVGRGWARIAAVLLMVSIGLSRLYLGVHSTGDVVAGWLFGGLVLWACSRVEKLAGRWWARQGLAIQWLTLSLLFVILLYLGIGIKLSLGGWSVPEEWINNAARANPTAPPIAPLRLRDTLVSLGALWGLGVGGAWLAAQGGYSTGGSARQRTGRLLVGTLAALALGLGIYPLVPAVESWPLYLAYVLISALAGLWVSALAPMAFVRLGLAQRESVV